MASRHTSTLSLSLSGLDLLTMNTSHLAIASHLYPNLLYPRVLTPNHIAAIKINICNHSADPLSPPIVLINGAAIEDESLALIRHARAYGQHRRILARVEKGEVNVEGDDYQLWEDLTRAMSLVEYAECIENWLFIESLEGAGESGQKEVLEKGWAAFELVPDQVKRTLGLLEESKGEEIETAAN